MDDNSNLPWGINQRNEMFEVYEPKMTACGCGKAYGQNENTDCDICNNTGLVEMTPEMERDKKEERKENKSNL